MSNEHPIPKALRDRFDQIEDAICRNRMERDAVFTQMITAVQAHFMSAEPVGAIPDGYCIMPRRLTAENGAKALLLGEFKVYVTQDCPECVDLDEPDENCEICDGEGEYCQHHMISWDQIKFIYSKAVEGLSASAEPAQSRDLDEHDRSAQDYWADQAAQGKPYEAQLREACERNGIGHGLDDASAEPTNKESAQ